MPVPVPVYHHQSGRAPSPLLTGLVSYWKLDEASGNRVDAHGANNLAPMNTPGNAAGKIGNALALVAASSQLVWVASNASLTVAATSFTFTGWIYVASDADMYVLAKDDGGAGAEYALKREITTGSLYWTVYDATPTPLTISIAGPALTTWAFFACWYDSSTSKISMSLNNGAVTTSVGTITPWAGTTNFALGRRWVAADWWDGRLDAIGFWKRTLSAAELTQLYNGGAGLGYPF